MRIDRERLLDMLEAIEKIEKYSVRGWAVFQEDELIQNWIISQIRILGEAARALTDDFRKAHPQIPWYHLIGMRNILVHQYFGIDHEIVWEVVIKDLPRLKAQIQNILGEF